VVAGGAGDEGGAASGGEFVAGNYHEVQDAGPGRHVVAAGVARLAGGSQGGRGAGRRLGLGRHQRCLGLRRLRPGNRGVRPERAKLAFDLGNGMGHGWPLQILRHRRPSRASNSSAAAGPHDPDA
jgi:hypothetical protein